MLIFRLFFYRISKKTFIYIYLVLKKRGPPCRMVIVVDLESIAPNRRGLESHVREAI